MVISKDSQLGNMKKVRNFEVLKPKWNVCITFLPSSLKKGISVQNISVGGREIVRARGNTQLKESNVFQRQ